MTGWKVTNNEGGIIVFNSILIKDTLYKNMTRSNYIQKENSTGISNVSLAKL